MDCCSLVQSLSLCKSGKDFYAGRAHHLLPFTAWSGKPGSSMLLDLLRCNTNMFTTLIFIIHVWQLCSGLSACMYNSLRLFGLFFLPYTSLVYIYLWRRRRPEGMQTLSLFFQRQHESALHESLPEFMPQLVLPQESPPFSTHLDTVSSAHTRFLPLPVQVWLVVSWQVWVLRQQLGSSPQEISEEHVTGPIGEAEGDEVGI